MRQLVFGGTGTTGSAVVRALRARGQEIRVFSRDPSRVKALGEGVMPVVGNLLEPASLQGAFEGVDGVFLLNAVSQTEASEGLTVLTALRGSGVKRLAYLSVQSADVWPHLPHFGSKVAIETAVKASGLEWTILRPNNFYQNEAWFKDAILQHSVYPQPIGERGISRVDVRDIADVAVAALVDGGHGGKTYDLVGPEGWTGPRTAEAWSHVVGKPIRYAGNDLDTWEKQQLAYLPAWMVFDFRHMYERFQREGWLGTEQDVATLTKVMGHAPRRFEDYAKEAAANWAKTGAPA